MSEPFDPTQVLWYRAPAGRWEEALPVGNGRLGAMVFGRPSEERIQLNEDTLWTGGPYSTSVPGGHQVLSKIQALVFQGEHRRAETLFGRRLMGYPVEQQKYQPLGNLVLTFPGEGAVSDYVRDLDLSRAVARIRFRRDGATMTREVFSSPVDQVLVVRLSSDRPGRISFRAQLQGVRNQAHSNYATDYFRMDGDGVAGLKLSGKGADYLGVEGRVRYHAGLQTAAEGGDVSVEGRELVVDGADSVTLLVAAATSFVDYRDVEGNPEARVRKTLEAAEEKPWEDLLQDHLAAHRELFNRVKLRLPASRASTLPTDERMRQPDPALAALAYQFGRYVLLCSSRPGTEPANLQGIWNEDSNPSWDAKYTTNINTEMNYWAVDSAGLSECMEPFLRLVREVAEQGVAVAQEHYGARGWVLHQNTDIWRVAAPMDGPTWGTFTTGGAWLCTHLWEHYQHTHDREFLQSAYPLLKGNAQFFLDFLVEHPKRNWLVTNPSTSPENVPAAPGNEPFFDEVTSSIRPGTSICWGSTIDMQILRDLFSAVVSASEILGNDPVFREQVRTARSRLAPMQVGRNGALQEWGEDWGSLEEEHRHVSHLYGLFPGHVISPVKTPNLVDPCRRVLEQRGDGGVGWSHAWKMALWARLYDGNRALRIFRHYLCEQCCPQLFSLCFTTLQVDGTLGVTAAISEMLVQSHEGYIDFLPALPDEWTKGSFAGVRLRGGFEADFSWRNGRLLAARMTSLAGSRCRIRVDGPRRIRQGDRILTTTPAAGGLLEFATSPGESYHLEDLESPAD